MELYECAATILKLQDDLLQRWSGESRQIIRLGASTIPSAYHPARAAYRLREGPPGVYFFHPPKRQPGHCGRPTELQL